MRLNPLWVIVLVLIGIPWPGPRPAYSKAKIESRYTGPRDARAHAERDSLDHPGKWTITAQRLIFYHASNVVVGEGSVVVKNKDMVIKGDRITFNWKSGEAVAYGGVAIEMGRDRIYASSGRFNVKSGIGELKSARLFLSGNHLHIEAKELEKKGLQEYEARDAVISTCSPPKQAWSFACKRLALDEDGMVTAWGTKFRVRSLPILYSPWVKVPLNKYKKSGLLIPSISTSKRNGFGINIPYYLVLNDSADMTFYQNPISKRGWMQGVEFRYMASQASRGIIRYNFLIDTENDHDFNGDGYSRENEKRWWLRAKFNQELPYGFKGLADIDLISDMDYLQEFDYGPMGYGRTDRTFHRFFHRFLADDSDLIRPSYVQAQKETSDSFIGAQLRYNDNQIPGDQDSTIQTLPRVNLKGFKKRIGLEDSRLPFPIYASYDVSYVNYWREEGLKEQRIYAAPTLEAPLNLFNAVDLTLGTTLEERFFRVEGGSYTTKNKLSPRFDLDATTTLEHFYGLGHAMRHSIRPRLLYTYRPHNSQASLPDIDELDRLPGENRITLELLSFLTKKTEAGAYHDLLRFKVRESYEMEGKSLPTRYRAKGRHFSDIYGEVELYLGNTFLRYDTTYNVYGDGSTSYNIWAHGSIWRISSMDLAYRYSEITNINEFNLYLEGRIMERLYGRYRVKKSFEQEKDLESEYGLRYESGCWALNGLLHIDRDETRITFGIELLGLGGWTMPN